METETYFLEKKYSKFTENMKYSLKKAVQRGNIKLANIIQIYLDTIVEMKKVYKLKSKNDDRIYRDDIKMYENKLEDLQLKIIDIQFNNTDMYNKDKIIIDIPKNVNNDLNFIFMFIYKFIQINSKILCILFKNIVDSLFNVNILDDTDIKNICSSGLLKNISIVYNTENQKISYKYRTTFTNETAVIKTNYENIQKKLDKIVERINKYDINKNVKIFNIELNEKTRKDFKVMLATIIVNLLRDLHCPKSTSNKTPYELFMEDKEKQKEIYINNDKTEGSYTPDELNEKMRQEWDSMKTTEEGKKNILNYERMAKNKFTKKFTNTRLKKYLCDYFTINPKYDINKEYDLLYNHFLTRDLTEKDMKNKTKTDTATDTNINIIIPYFSLSFVNNLVVFMYIFIKNNKNDICSNIKNILNTLKKKLSDHTFSIYDSGDYYYKQNKILSLCSSNPKAQSLIHTFYSKYKEYDKVLISNLLLKIINNNSLKIKYDLSKDNFEIVIINEKDLDIDFTEIDKSKLLHGLNEDLKCINKNINKNVIVKILNFTTDMLNKILGIITDKKLITSIFNLSTESEKIYSYLNDRKLNFKIRKLIVIIFIKFITIHISKFYLDPYSSQYNMYDSLMTDIYKHLCKTLTVEFDFNIFKKMEELYEEFPSYDI